MVKSTARFRSHPMTMMTRIMSDLRAILFAITAATALHPAQAVFGFCLTRPSDRDHPCRTGAQSDCHHRARPRNPCRGLRPELRRLGAAEAGGKSGQTIYLRFAGNIYPDGTIYTANLRGANPADRYICKGGGEEIWEPRFTYHGFRYVQIVGLAEKPTVESLTGIVTHSGGPITSTFASSPPSRANTRPCAFT